MGVQVGRGIVVCAVARTRNKPIVPVVAGGRALLVVRDGETFYVCARACPHDYADLRDGRVAAGRLHCPRHQASFDLATGAVSPGWDCADLETFAACVRGADVVVDLDAPPPLRPQRFPLGAGRGKIGR